MTENTTTATKIVGRRSEGWGVEMQVVTIGDEQFLTRGGKVYRECGDCDGGCSGTKMVYAGLDNGVCYRCDGRGVARKFYDSVEAVEKAQRAAARRQAKAAEKAAEKAAAADADRAAWAAANPVAAERLAAVYAEVYAPFEQYSGAAYEAAEKGEAKYGEFVLLMANYASYKALTENQTTAAIEALDKALVRAAAAADRAAAQRYLGAEKGAKVEVTGTVAVSMDLRGDYGVSRMVIVEGTGDFVGVTFKMTGTAASLFETERGDSVRITGKIKDYREYNGTPQTVLHYAKAAVLATA